MNKPTAIEKEWNKIESITVDLYTDALQLGHRNISDIRKLKKHQRRIQKIVYQIAQKWGEKGVHLEG